MGPKRFGSENYRVRKVLRNLGLEGLGSETSDFLIVYTCSGVRRLSSVLPSVHFSFETAWPIKAKFYDLEEGGTKLYVDHLGHMTKMDVMAIHRNKIFSRTRRPMILKLGMKHRLMKLYKVYINHDILMTLTYITARSISRSHMHLNGKN